MSRSCNFSCCLAILFVLVLFFVLGIIIFLLIFLPQELKFTVTDASLAHFNYIAEPNNTLFYSLALNVTVRNPNKKIGFYFRRFQVVSSYRKKQFSLVNLDLTVPFYLGHKNSTVFVAAINGEETLTLKEKDMKQYDKETGLGFYSVNVKLTLWVRVRYGKIKSMRFEPLKMECKLKIPLSSPNNGTSINSGYGFRATRCVTMDIYSAIRY